MTKAAPRPVHLIVTGLFLAATAALLSACGSSGGSPAASSPAAGSSSAGTPGAGATVATTGAGTPADAATKTAITKAFQDFFDYQSTAQQSQDALQDGDRFTAVLTQQGTQSYAQKSAATVASASLLSPDTAKVVFTVSVGGQALLPDATGYAVRLNGSWKVAATTFCSLLELEGDKAPACSDPSVTALPQ
jgi:hypothetical protein